jgi:predicted AAA+ superfamily ATPase
VLTGSSARKLKRAGVDLLAGRLSVRTLHPFLAAELGSAFVMEDALRWGLVPLIFSASSPEETLKGYIALYLQEEVKAEGLVRRVGDFSRFLEAISFSHGSVLNISNVARECQVNRKVVESYVEILDDLLLSFRLSVFSKRARRATVAHDKFYLFDAGVYRSLRPTGPLDRPEEIDGGALEGLVAQHLRALCAYQGDCQLFYWRTRGGSEVDFVVYGKKRFWAIEVKNTLRIRPDDLRGLRSFREDYPEAETFLLYRGRERIKQREILCLPCGEFLSSLVPS